MSPRGSILSPGISLLPRTESYREAGQDREPATMHRRSVDHLLSMGGLFWTGEKAADTSWGVLAASKHRSASKRPSAAGYDWHSTLVLPSNSAGAVCKGPKWIWSCVLDNRAEIWCAGCSCWWGTISVGDELKALLKPSEKL